MPTLVTHPKTGKPVWDYDLEAEQAAEKSTKKAAPKKATTDKGEES